jgi:hypothetical protein
MSHFTPEKIRYGHAIDLMSAVVAHYSELIALEKVQSQPDLQKIEKYFAIKNMIHEERHLLQPYHIEQVEYLISKYEPMIQKWYHQLLTMQQQHVDDFINHLDLKK